MELLVRIPEGFRRKEKREGAVHMAPGGRWAILVTPLGPAQPDPAGWSLRAAELHAKPGVVTQVLVTSSLTTDEGWPVSLLEADVGPERRIIAYLQVFDFCAGIVSVRIEPGAEDEWRAGTMAIIAGTRVTFEGPSRGVSCLAELLGGVVKPAIQSTPVVD